MVIVNCSKTKKTTGEHVSDILNEMSETFRTKNKDYGGAVDITYLMLGENAPLVRVWDKLLRVTQLTISGKAEVKSESVEDTLIDLATYAIIALAQRRAFENNSDELGQVFKNFIESARLTKSETTKEGSV